jgi:RNA polymerase sigma-70 factor (ECF subfamily)
VLILGAIGGRDAAAAVVPSPFVLLSQMAEKTTDWSPVRGSDAESSSAGPSATDSDDLLAAREGDQRAACRLVEGHGKSMVRTAWRVLGSHGTREADDVVQEAFIAALTTRALPTGDLGAWLRAITARKALDALRRTGRRAEDPLPEADGEGRQLEAPDELGGRLDVLTVREALRTLSPKDRAVLTLVDLEGRSMAETAAALGLTRVATKLRASRARKKLARLLRGQSRTQKGGDDREH